MIQFSPKSCSENICSVSFRPVIELNDSNGPRLEGKKVWKCMKVKLAIFAPRPGDSGKSLRKQQDGRDLIGLLTRISFHLPHRC